MTEVLVDTGPLVAVLARRDQHQARCVEVLKGLSPPLLTCWPVITETAYLLRDHAEAIQALLRMLEHGFLELLPLDVSDVPWLRAFFEKYRDQEPQLADAALLRLAERDGLDTIFTIDHRHFKMYRIAGNKALHLLPKSFDDGLPCGAFADGRPLLASRRKLGIAVSFVEIRHFPEGHL